jgi:hypothetical protein
MGRACSTYWERNAYRILVAKSEGNVPLPNLDTGARIILKWILEKLDGVVWTGLIWLRTGTSRGLF